MSHRPRRVAAFFDLDKTIIATSSVFAFNKSFLGEGLLSRRSVIDLAYTQLAFSLSDADDDRNLSFRLDSFAISAREDSDMNLEETKHRTNNLETPSDRPTVALHAHILVWQFGTYSVTDQAIMKHSISAEISARIKMTFLY